MERQPSPGQSDLPQTQKRKCRTRSHQRKPAARTGPPTEEKVQRERQEVVAAVASLGVSSPGPVSPSQGASEERSESDSESLASLPSSMILPVITSVTAYELI
ncbi:hypothetical protein NDU88_007934 [Pleurodeles waltl]|uniref:Uncharacterized protein n=1 Tax=Pleurodeles waltl TaxID=8319 RepID=A0AAV7VR41_PLEWA|nr:hypothetical protein NDU88_007934 [Pleurodeles waltl]